MNSEVTERDRGLSLGLVTVQSERSLGRYSDGQASGPGSDADRAYRRLARELVQKQKRDDLAGMAACFIQIGDLLLSRGDSEGAGDMYRKALRLSRAANSGGPGQSGGRSRDEMT